MTLADMLDPHWWTLERMIIAFIFVVIGISLLREAWND
jgi:hypothetical protein